MSVCLYLPHITRLSHLNNMQEFQGKMMELREGRNEAHTNTLFVDQVSVLSSCMYSLLLLLLWYFVLRCSGARLDAGHYLYLGSGNTRTLELFHEQCQTLRKSVLYKLRRKFTIVVGFGFHQIELRIRK